MTAIAADPYAGNPDLFYFDIIFLVSMLLAYFLPWMVAVTRGTTNKGTVFLINFFLGWTGICWLVALVLAFAGRKQEETSGAE